MEKEKWKNLQFFISIRPLYKISNYGTIVNNFTGKVLKCYIDKDGYTQISLPLETNGNGKKMKRFAIHRLVAYNFVDGFVKGLTVNHKDGVKSNNFYKNLEWVTRLDNLKHAIDNKLNRLSEFNSKKGSASNTSKMSDELVSEICEAIVNGLSSREIHAIVCEKHPGLITQAAVKNIRRKARWTHISDKYFTVSTVGVKGNQRLVIQPV